MVKISGGGSMSITSNGTVDSTCFDGSTVHTNTDLTRNYSVGMGSPAEIGGVLSAPVTSPATSSTGSYSTTGARFCPCSDGNCSNAGSLTPTSLGAYSGTSPVITFNTRPDPANPSITQYQLTVSIPYGTIPGPPTLPSGALNCTDGTRAQVVPNNCAAVCEGYSIDGANSDWIYASAIIGTHSFSYTYSCTNPNYPAAGCCVNPEPSVMYSGGLTFTLTASITIVSA